MIELFELQYFQAVATLEHVTKAAQKLHISQPNLSNAISRLESKLGVQLFERTRGRVKLTDTGREYLVYVNEAFSILEAGELRIKELSNNASSQILVSCSVNSLISTIIDTFLEQNPTVAVTQNLLSTEAITHQLSNNEIDFAITMRPPTGQKIQWTPVIKSELFVGVSDKHPFASRKSIPLSMLENQPIICNNVGADRVIVEELCAKGGFKPTISLESNDGQFIGERLQKDGMLTLIPSYDLYKVHQLKRDVERPLTPVRIEDVDAYVTLGLCRRTDRKLFGASQLIYQFTKEYLDREKLAMEAYMVDVYSSLTE